jgi:hypothetical protein
MPQHPTFPREGRRDGGTSSAEVGKGPADIAGANGIARGRPTQMHSLLDSRGHTFEWKYPRTIL